MKTLQNFALIFLTFTFLFSCQNKPSKDTDLNPDPLLKEGFWKGELKVMDQDVPFLFYVNEEDKITIINSEEEIKMEAIEEEGDSATVYFVNYPNYLRFKIEEDQLSGYYWKTDVGGKSKLDLEATYLGLDQQDYLNSVETDKNIGGNWEITFRPKTDLAYPSVGKFRQTGSIVTGTFLKRSGDSRFLKGTLSDSTLSLYAFDGAQASLYVAKIRGDSIHGKYMPNNYTIIEWIGRKNDNFQLESPDSITYLVENEFKLNLKTVEGEAYNIPNTELKDKLVIIQIMGTWCPNCLDESRFFKELYREYHKKGLEILGVSYEYPKNFEDQAARIKRYAEKEEIPYPILVAGQLNSENVAEDFYMLNAVVAFPTAIYLNKKGEVVKIHTGFSGPGTGEDYELLKKDIRQFIEEQLD